ncbi:MAG: sugar ABC transporter ATP-binding protein, partial [Clostridiales bacterium]|nr:sugar ABC transporter ATP-binding protein [Clostridiales bacterium]
MESNAQNLLLSIENCSKGFPGVQALKDIDLKLHAGEIHCIVGENGAGKSTLIKILSGALQPDTGRIVYLGNEYKSFTPKQAQLLGIQTIYQEIELIPYMTVAENIFLGHETFFINYKSMREKAAQLIKSFGVDIDPGDLIIDLPIAQKQTVQILRALAMDAKVLIMDEPTASFSKSEIQHLLEMTRSIADKGVGIIYISHHLDEVFEIHDSITVLRDGTKVAWHGKNEVSDEQLICEMVGRCTDMFYRREKVPIDKTQYVEFKNFSRGDK